MKKTNQSYLLLSLLTVLVSSSCIKSKKNNHDDPAPTPVTHYAHLTGSWYPSDPDLLHQTIDSYLKQAQESFYVEADARKVKALIVPHAGYRYSGLCAATAYQTILPTKNLLSHNLKNKNIDRVIIIAPSHTTFLHGVALPDYTIYRTPLGTIDVDYRAIAELKKHEIFKTFGQAHATEHAVEMQLPFLQKTIDNFSIVPLIVGHVKQTDFPALSSALQQIITDTTLVVISSDFMHHGTEYEYKPFDDAIINRIRFVDSLTVEAIAQRSLHDFNEIINETDSTICGQNPIKILLHLAAKNVFGDIHARLSCYYTSAHMHQARLQDGRIDINKLIGNVSDQEAQSSVSYAGLVFTQDTIEALNASNQLTGFEKASLLKAARDAVENELKPEDQRLEEHLIWPLASPGLKRIAGLFTTINKQDGSLRGCIGQIIARKPLYQNIIPMSLSAAFKDTRFSPVTYQELSDVVFDVTILTPPRPVSHLNEIQLGKHGIMLNKFDKDGTIKASAVFLPQVPHSFGWNLPETLQHLSKKAGIGSEGWKDNAQLSIFEGLEIKE